MLGRIEQLEKDAKRKSNITEGVNKRAEDVLALAEQGYRAITSQGLASAFASRSNRATWAMALWTLGLIVALVGGGIASSRRVDQLLEALVTTPDQYSVVLRLAALLLTTGGTVWFAWLASLQIGYSFRLAEDYAHKASLSAAYEGYRQEAIRKDDGLDRRLLEIAIVRLDEIPLRVVDPHVPSSPLHALANTDAAKRTLGILPRTLSRFVPKSVLTAAAERQNATRQATLSSTPSNTSAPAE